MPVSPIPWYRARRSGRGTQPAEDLVGLIGMLTNTRETRMKTARLTDSLVALNRRRFSLALPLLGAVAAWPQRVLAATASSPGDKPLIATHHRTRTIDGIKVFYREAGPADAPVVLLLHGFPTSSHMFRNLIPELADRYHIIAPDYPG